MAVEIEVGQASAPVSSGQAGTPVATTFRASIPPTSLRGKLPVEWRGSGTIQRHIRWPAIPDDPASRAGFGSPAANQRRLELVRRTQAARPDALIRPAHPSRDRKGAVVRTIRAATTRERWFFNPSRDCKGASTHLRAGPNLPGLEINLIYPSDCWHAGMVVARLPSRL